MTQPADHFNELLLALTQTAVAYAHRSDEPNRARYREARKAVTDYVTDLERDWATEKLEGSHYKAMLRSMTHDVAELNQRLANLIGNI